MMSPFTLLLAMVIGTDLPVCIGVSRPIIGVLAQSCHPEDHIHGDSYIPSMYVKWLESGGARVVPIRVNVKDYKYYEKVFKSVNGVVFPGGAVNILTSYFAQAANRLYQMALKANDNGDYFPLWGTCRGLQLLTALRTGRNLLTTAPVMDMRPLHLAPDFEQSRLFGDLPTDILVSLMLFNVTANHHHMGLSTRKFYRNKAMRSFYRVLSTNIADNGNDHVSTVEAINYPFYGIQWHPEKIPYKWDPEDTISHTERAIRVSQYFADFFVNECRKSNHHFPDLDKEISAVIDNYHPYFSRDASFKEYYFFNFTTV